MIAALFKTEALSEISRDIAQVFFAGLFIEPIATGNANIYFLFFGLLLALAAWVWSLLLAQV